MPLEAASQETLLQVARGSISAGLGGQAYTPEADDPRLREPRATFVTLHRQSRLRGCIGTLEAVRPLLQDVSHNARAAAFHDPRFTPVAATELTELLIEISVLSPPQAMRADSRATLLQNLKPGGQGLILQEGARRATFLPAVWESLPDPGDFLDQLLHKAGLPPEYWSGTLRFFSYETESFGEQGI
jgi:AmmeMemoRadiSam system protein A